MRFMVIVKATPESEKEGALPDPQLMVEMGKYNEELMKAGVLLALDGLHPSSKGARVKFSGKSRTVIDGPFTETKELIAGFWILQVKSLEEAIEWVKRCPNSHAGDSEVEIRQVFEMEDFAPILSEEQIQHKVRARLSCQIRPPTNSRSCTPRIEAGVIGSSVRYRSTPHHRSRLAHRVRPRHRRPHPPHPRRRPAPKTSPRTPSSPPSNSGRNPASPTIPAHGSPPPPNTAPSISSAATPSLERKHARTRPRPRQHSSRPCPTSTPHLDDTIGDDLLRLVFISCHPILSTESRAALTLRLLGGLTTDEIARAFLTPEPTIAQRIVRAKRTLAEKHIPFEVPRGPELAARLSSVLEVIYLIFNEGYSATAGDDLIRPTLCEDALRLGRILAELTPNEPEVHGLVALMEIQASRTRARITPTGEPILLLDQNRAHWDQLLIHRGLTAIDRADKISTNPGPLPPASRDSRLPRPSPHPRRHRLAPHRHPSTPNSPSLTPSPSSSSTEP